MDVFNYIKLQKELERDEGRREKPYECSAGKLTIGVGWNLEDRGLPKRVIDMLFNISTDDAINDAVDLIPNFYELSQVRQRVLANMSFNLGLTRLSKFKKMLDAVRRNDYDLAAKEMLDSKWARQVGDRAVRLAEMMREG